MPRSFQISDEQNPDIPSLMLATLNALRAVGGCGHLHDLDEKVAEMEQVTTAERRVMTPNGTATKFKYYLAWARTYLKRGQAITNSRRAFWRLTERGCEISSIREC